MNRLKILLIAAIAAVALAGAFYMWLSGSIGGIIREQGSRALGVETSVQSAGLSLFPTAINVAGLGIANPEGFRSPRFMEIERIGAEIEAGSFLGPALKAPLVEVQGVTLHLVNESGQLNCRKILASLRQAVSGKAGSDASSGRNWIISRLEIRNIQARLSLRPGGAAAEAVPLDIPDITLKNVGTAEDAANLDEILRTVVESVLRGAVSQTKGRITRELLGNLWGKLAGEPGAGKPSVSETELRDAVNDLQRLLNQP